MVRLLNKARVQQIVPTCNHCKSSVNEFPEIPSPAAPGAIIDATVEDVMLKDMQNQYSTLIIKLKPLLELRDSRRKFGSELRKYMSELKFRTPQWQKQMKGQSSHLLTRSHCPKCGTIQRTFYKGYEEEEKLVADNIKSNKDSINYLKDMLRQINKHLEKLGNDDKKVKAIARKKAKENKRKKEISELKNRLDKLQQEEE